MGARPAAAGEFQAVCPVNGRRGVPVRSKTVKALLKEVAPRRFEGGYHGFCEDPTCAIVYDSDTGSMYTRTDIREPVWQKVPAGNRKLCYCFDENERDMQCELERSGVCMAAARVRDHIAAGRCACDIRNPEGSCCLADVQVAIERLKPRP